MIERSVSRQFTIHNYCKCIYHRGAHFVTLCAKPGISRCIQKYLRHENFLYSSNSCTTCSGITRAIKTNGLTSERPNRPMSERCSSVGHDLVYILLAIDFIAILFHCIFCALSLNRFPGIPLGPCCNLYRPWLIACNITLCRLLVEGIAFEQVVIRDFAFRCMRILHPLDLLIEEFLDVPMPN